MRTHRLFHLTLLFISLLVSTGLMAQIVPNSSFEVWEMSPEGINEPVGWETDNMETVTSVSPISPAYSGYLAMRVTTYDTGVGAYGNASTTIAITELPTSLGCAVKYQTTMMGAVFISYSLYNDGMLVGSGDWSPSNNEATTWEFVDLVIDDPGVPVTDIRLDIHAAVGDMYFGTAEITVDDIFFQTILDVDEEMTAYLNVYPNPTSDRLIIGHRAPGRTIDRVRMVDMSGRLVMDGTASMEVDVSALPEGRYEVELLDADGAVVMQKGVLIE